MSPKDDDAGMPLVSTSEGCRRGSASKGREEEMVRETGKVSSVSLEVRGGVARGVQV